jgi:hypothetical protein
VHYQIEYYNKIWKDWLAFDQLFYKTKEQAQKVINAYKPKIKTRIVQTNILNEKPKKVRTERVGPTVTVEKTRTSTWPH